MSILANPSYFEQEQLGTIEQALVAVRYVGASRKYSSPAAANQGRFPDRHAFLRNVWYVAFVPETVPDGDSGSGVAWFERSSDFDVEFDPERIAEILLDKNYLDLEPGGPIGESDALPGFNQKVADALGLEDEIEAGATYEDQLKSMAGVDEAAATEEADPVDQLVNEHDRAELKERVKAARADAEEFSLRGASMQDMAAFLVETGSDTEQEV